MPWESIVYVGVLVVVLALVLCDCPTGQSREDRRVARLMRGKR